MGYGRALERERKLHRAAYRRIKYFLLGLGLCLCLCSSRRQARRQPTVATWQLVGASEMDRRGGFGLQIISMPAMNVSDSPTRVGDSESADSAESTDCRESTPPPPFPCNIIQRLRKSPAPHGVLVSNLPGLLALAMVFFSHYFIDFSLWASPPCAFSPRGPA